MGHRPESPLLRIRLSHRTRKYAEAHTCSDVCCQVTRAISEGDFGRVEDILTTLGMMFRRAGSKNYSMEIMHFTHNMKKVWTANGFEFIHSFRCQCGS
ncbi:hypothetical protein C8R44DRAFT_616068 [Mycena epipterygia]|nr:hypothetical protein C8R44DRAFT_616068 [Mycena epipterygia]